MHAHAFQALVKIQPIPRRVQFAALAGITTRLTVDITVRNPAPSLTQDNRGWEWIAAGEYGERSLINFGPCQGIPAQAGRVIFADFSVHNMHQIANLYLSKRGARNEYSFRAALVFVRLRVLKIKTAAGNGGHNPLHTRDLFAVIGRTVLNALDGADSQTLAFCPGCDLRLHFVRPRRK